jgi:cell cycle serine/threonine-protein kinase CDC5/MSD2
MPHLHVSPLYFKAIYFFHVPSSGESCLTRAYALPFTPLQTLMELVKRRRRLTEPEARYWSLQLLDAIRYMHANGVIHRDLKLGNLFINEDMELRVGDFGLATWLSKPGERRRTLCGTPNYIAPEILEQPAAGHSFEVDTWSFGVILYTLLVGRPPFETASVEETYQRIRDTSFSFPADCGVSAAARDLITWILQKDPAARPTLSQVRSTRGGGGAVAAATRK